VSEILSIEMRFYYQPVSFQRSEPASYRRRRLRSFDVPIFEHLPWPGYVIEIAGLCNVQKLGARA
jgi:hypothetical protein